MTARRSPRPSAAGSRRDGATGDGLYGDGKAGARIADLLATVPLTTTKRLAY